MAALRQAVQMVGQQVWQGLAPLPDMSDELFRQWVKLLEERTGTLLPEERKSFLLTSLGMRMREIGFTDYRAYFDFLHQGHRGSVEWATLVDRLTIHETRFFRQGESLELITKYLLSCHGEHEGDKRKALQVWSVGCSTGEEAYTLAILIDDFFKARGEECYFGVTATDISLASLAYGRKGVYHKLKLSGVPPELLRRYFVESAENRYQVIDALRQRVCFTHCNVLEIDQASFGSMDLIYCQNVLIYFDRERRIEILNGLCEHLAPGGLLVLGPGEMLGWEHPALERIEHGGTLAFRRRYLQEGEAR